MSSVSSKTLTTVALLNNKATHASTSAASDGEQIYVNFAINKAAYCSALNMEGKILWQRRLGDYKVHQG